MPVRVQAPDGSVVEFPDGTSQRTMEAAMKAQFPKPGSLQARNIPIVSGMAKAGAEQMAQFEAGRDRGRAAKAAPAPLFSRIIPDTLEPIQQAAGLIRQGYRDSVAVGQRGAPNNARGLIQNEVDQQGAGLKVASGAVGLIAAPFTAPINAGVGLMARGAERLGLGNEAQNREALNTGLMGGRAAPGLQPRAINIPARPARELARRTTPDVAAMRARADELRAQGIDPTYVDVADETGRAVVRATASRQTPARQVATNFADGRAADLPSRVGAQARRTISPDARTPDKIRAEAAAERKAKGDANFELARKSVVPLPDDVLTVLKTPAGRTALQQAAANARQSLSPLERSVADELDTLAERTLDQRNPRMSVAAVQEISKSLYDAAEVQFRAGNGRQGTLLKELASSVRSNARSKIPAYDKALTEWEADSRLIEAADVGETFMARNTDEFAAATADMGPEELALAQAAARRAVERKAGESVSAAPGVARQIALAPEQQARNRALLGDERAAGLESAMQSEAMLVRNASDIAPRTGAQTQLRGQDADAVAGAAQVIKQGIRGEWFGMAMDWLRSRGISNEVAEQITRRAIDPTELDGLLVEMEQTLGRNDALLLLKSLGRPEVLAPALQSSGAALEVQ